MAKPDLYISADVEADGPIPGRYSMLSFGLCVAATFDGETFTPHDPRAETFYAELKPISDNFLAEALAVSGLDRATLSVSGAEPVDAMNGAAGWVQDVCGSNRPVLAAYPAGFDWTFLYWYFETYADGGSPFAYNSLLDVKTLYAVKAGVVFGEATKRDMPRQLLSRRPHTHNALDDAVEQADLFVNLFRWDGRR
jgi:hypothetical protein